MSVETSVAKATALTAHAEGLVGLSFRSARTDAALAIAHAQLAQVLILQEMSTKLTALTTEVIATNAWLSMLNTKLGNIDAKLLAIRDRLPTALDAGSLKVKVQS